MLLMFLWYLPRTTNYGYYNSQLSVSRKVIFQSISYVEEYGMGTISSFINISARFIFFFSTYKYLKVDFLWLEKLLLDIGSLEQISTLTYLELT